MVLNLCYDFDPKRTFGNAYAETYFVVITGPSEQISGMPLNTQMYRTAPPEIIMQHTILIVPRVRNTALDH